MGCSRAGSFLSGPRKCLHEGQCRVLLFWNITSDMGMRPPAHYRPVIVGPQPELVDMPLGGRWYTRLAFRDNVRITDIEFYRDQLDQQLESQITWRPYTNTLLETLLAFCLAGSQVWRSRTTLVYFHIIELHYSDRVLRQFGLLQHIPEVVLVIPRINSRDRTDEDWAVYHASYIQRWNDILVDIAWVDPEVYPDPIRATNVYMRWYRTITGRWIFTPVLEATSRVSVTWSRRESIGRYRTDIILYDQTYPARYSRRWSIKCPITSCRSDGSSFGDFTYPSTHCTSKTSRLWWTTDVGPFISV